MLKTPDDGCASIFIENINSRRTRNTKEKEPKRNFGSLKDWRQPTLAQAIQALPSARLCLTAEFGMGSGRATALWPPKNCLGQLSLVSGSCDRATVMTQVKDQPPVRAEFRGFAADNGLRTTDKEQCSLKTTHRSGKFVRELNRLFFFGEEKNKRSSRTTD